MEINPCPHCGKPAIHHTNVEQRRPEDWRFWVGCSHILCVSGPVCETKDAAILAWNRLGGVEAARLWRAIQNMEEHNPYLAIGDCLLDRIYQGTEWRLLQQDEGGDHTVELWREPDLISALLRLARAGEPGE